MIIRKALAIAATTVSIAAVSAGAALAGPSCTSEPQTNWMPEAHMKRMITDQGYTIKEFKISGSCYEFYGKTKEGKRAEIYYNPVTGAVVKQKLG